MTDYEEYLEKYCISRGITKEEAEKHVLVKEYAKYCKEKEARVQPTKTELSCGCGGMG